MSETTEGIAPSITPAPLRRGRSSVTSNVIFVSFLVLLTSAGGYLVVQGFKKPVATVAAALELSVDPSSVDFDQKRQGDVVVANFRLTNHFPDTVTILSALTGCSCEAAEIESKSLMPGASTLVSITWSLRSKHGRVEDSAWVIFRTAAGKNDRVELTVKADVLPDIRCEPRRLKFAEDRAEIRRIRLSTGAMPDFQIKDVYANHNSLAVRFDTATSDVVVDYTPGKGARDKSGVTIAIETSSPHEPIIRLPVYFEASE